MRSGAKKCLAGAVAAWALLPMWLAGEATNPKPNELVVMAKAVQASSAQRDRFGGIGPTISQPTGFFQVKKVKDRWMFVTPEGNCFWMNGVYAVVGATSVDDLGTTGDSRVMPKFNNDVYLWGKWVVKRLKVWGFNTLAEYSSVYTLPWNGNWANPEQMPFVIIMNPSYYGLWNSRDFGSGPFKDVMYGTDPVTYTDWRNSSIPDVFDPNFGRYADGFMTKDESVTSVNGSPWLIGIALDDADHTFGFGPGPELPAPALHPHIGWIVAATAPMQMANPNAGGSGHRVTYTDPKVYSKYALRDFLKSKYRNIEALNMAWRSKYTTFDADGGWPLGKGFLDESGRNPWLGSGADGRMVGATDGVRADLDAFLYEFAKHYYTVLSGVIRQRAPHHLVFSQASLNGWGGLTRKEILRAVGETVDVIQVQIRDQRALSLTTRYVGDKPLVTWDSLIANTDSALYRYPIAVQRFQWPPVFQTQEARGQAYAEKLNFLATATAATGVHPVVGMKYWSYIDHWGEKANFGLVTFSQNAYDGREARKSQSLDPFGLLVGGEERDYGDFLSAVRVANQRAMTQACHPETR